jgi:ribonuclease BN (tRNA processing enzyme)
VELLVLGTCGSYAVADRNCSGYLVSSGGTRIWIDAGTGTLQELLRHVDLWDLDAIWISHLHADHWNELPSALQRMTLTRPHGKTAIPVFGPPGWVDGTGVTTRDRLDEDDPVLTAHELHDGATHEVGALTLEAVEMAHSKRTFGVRVTDGMVTFAYSADTGPDDSVLRVGRDADLFLCEAGVGPGDEMSGHLNPQQAAERAEEARVAHLVLTHLPPGADPEVYREAAAERFSGPVDVASDGRRFDIGAGAS